MATVEKLPERRATNSPQSYGNEKMKPSEAATYVKRMLSAYPDTSAGCSTEYLATMAETLCQFPRHVAVAASSPIHGVPKNHKEFRPSAGIVFEWCEQYAASASSHDRLAKAEQDTVARRAELQSMAEHPAYKRSDELALRGPGHRANLFVPSSSPRFQAMCDRAEGADPADYKFVAGGIKVRFDWWA